MRSIFLITILFLLSSYAYAQELAGTAIVVNIMGDVQCVSAKNQKLIVGDVLNGNDSIGLSNESTITLLEEDGKLVSYDNSFRLNSRSAPKPIVQKLIRQSLQNKNWIESARKSPKNNLRSQADTEITLLYPRNTKLRNPPDQLSWKMSAKTESEFNVSLRCYDNDFSLDEMTKNNNFSLNSDVSISTKRQYYWYVRDLHTELSEVPPAVWFYVLGPMELHNLDLEKSTIVSIMRQDTLSVAYQLLYVNLLMSYELYDECKTILDGIAMKDPKNSVVNTFYAIIFDKMDMPSESHRYIEYSEKFGN